MSSSSGWQRVLPTSPAPVPYFWRCPLWVGLQACRRLTKRTLSRMPWTSRLVSCLQQRQWGPGTVLYSGEVFGRYWPRFVATGLPAPESIVCEVGPGPSLDVSLMFALAGVREAVAVDYAPWASREASLARAGELAEVMLAQGGWSDEEQAAIRRRAAQGGLPLRYEQHPLEDLQLPAGSVDFLFSHAVLEHISDPAAAFASIARVLSPRGVAIHHIDLKDHGFLRNRNPVLMLQFPRWLWDCCTRGVPGSISRRRLSAYLQAATQAGLEVHVLQRHMLPQCPVPSGQLAVEFRGLSAEDLCTLDAEVLCCHASPIAAVEIRRHVAL